MSDKKAAEIHPQGRLIPASKWNDYHAWPPPGGLRALIFRQHENGFVSCVRRVGRRILIDEAAFRAWVDRQTEGQQ